VQEAVVTAARLPAPLALVPDAHVITADDIALHQSVFAFDALAALPGVRISRAGAFGGVTTVRIRGASSDKTLVLIDGAPVNDPTSPAGGFDFSSLDLADVDRIEVLSGPQGSLWGSDAIGGVIAVTTREPDGPRAGGEAGSFGTRRLTASAGTTSEHGALGLGAAWFDTGGISKADSRDGNTERDPFDSLTLQANGRVDPAEGLSLDAKVRYTLAHTAFDSFGGPTGVIDGPDSQTGRTVSGFLRAQLMGPFGVKQTLRLDGMDMDRASTSYFGGAAFPFEARGRRLDWRWTAERAGPGPSAVLVGVEEERAREDTGDGVQTSRNLGAFAVWRIDPSSRLSATLSARRDEPRDYAGVTTLRAAASVGLGGGVTVQGSWGQGFKAPSIFQTSYPCFECAPPGPAVGLRPEHAAGEDLALLWRSADGRIEARLAAYRLSVRDQIDYLYPQGYVNLVRTRTDGLEAEAKVELGGGWALKAAYAYADAKDLSTSAALIRIPAHAGSAKLSWRGRRADAVLTLRVQGRAADTYGEIKPFAVANLAGSYEVRRGLRLTARIENLTGARYQQAFGYGEPGFAVYAGFRLGD
jgi:vitamin B12 transporter